MKALARELNVSIPNFHAAVITYGDRYLCEMIFQPRSRNRPFATNDHMVHGGGQADYYSRTGTLKQRDLNQ